jgi:hypothetical protein
MLSHHAGTVTVQASRCTLKHNYCTRVLARGFSREGSSRTFARGFVTEVLQRFCRGSSQDFCQRVFRGISNPVPAVDRITQRGRTWRVMVDTSTANRRWAPTYSTGVGTSVATIVDAPWLTVVGTNVANRRENQGGEPLWEPGWRTIVGTNVANRSERTTVREPPL